MNNFVNTKKLSYKHNFINTILSTKKVQFDNKKRVVYNHINWVLLSQYINKAMTKRSNIDYRFQRADDGEMSAE